MPDQQVSYPGLPLRKLKTIIALPCSLLLRGLVVYHAPQGAEPGTKPANLATGQLSNPLAIADRDLVEFFGVRFFS